MTRRRSRITLRPTCCGSPYQDDVAERQCYSPSSPRASNVLSASATWRRHQLVRVFRDLFGRGESFVQKITGSPTVDRPLQRRPSDGERFTVVAAAGHLRVECD